MTIGIASRLKLRLFVEGVEIPVIAANIQGSPNGPAVCSIQIPPLEEATRFAPRSVVHLFFFDYAEAFSNLVTLKGASRLSRKYNDPTTYEKQKQRYENPQEIDGPYAVGSYDIERDTRNNKFKLLFTGEVMGYQYTKNVSSRTIVLNCMDLSNYWDYAYQEEGGDLFGPGIKALFSGGSSNLFTDFLETKGGAILGIINTPSAQYPELTGITGGLLHLVEAIGGFYYTSSDGKKKDTFAGQNLFFSIAELRLHISQMVHAYEKDDSAKRLLGGSYDGLFGRVLSGLGQQVSIRQAINAIAGAIFHETYSVNTPLFVPGSEGAVSGYTYKNLNESREYANIAAAVQQSLERIQEIRSEVGTAVENDVTISKRSEFTSEVRKTLNVERFYLERVRKEAKKLKGVVAELTKAISSIMACDLKFKNMSSRWGGKGQSKSNPASGTITDLDKAIAALQRCLETQVYSTPATKSRPAKLISQIIRPDTWFTAPPRCNVIFPDQYTQLNTARNYMAEPTRLLLKTHDEFFGEDELFDNYYFAPKAQTPKKQRADLQKLLERQIMNHEIYTGILPVFEKLGEFSIFGVRSGKNGKKEPKVGLAQRSANFLYFRYRFAARQVQVNGLFLPYIAPGFPALIIDRRSNYFVINSFNELYKKNGFITPDMTKSLGSHWLANIAEYTHSLSQNNGTTTLNCGYARTIDESVEFLGMVDPQEDQTEVVPNAATRVTTVATNSPPPLYTLGPNLGAVIRVTEVTQKYIENSKKKVKTTVIDTPKDLAASNAPRLPLYRGTQSKDFETVTVPVGVSFNIEALSKQDLEKLGNPKGYQYYGAWEIEEEIPVFRRKKVDLPVEELVRPGWYGQCWHPSKVGEVYESFFRTGAITDPQLVSDPGGVPQRTPDQDMDNLINSADQSKTQEEDVLKLATMDLTLDENSSISQASSFIIAVYNYIKNTGKDTKAFIDSYNWRPIATMVDMFGTSDLRLDEDGKKAESGVEGFHSRAFGSHSDLFGLVNPNIKSILGIKENDPAAVNLDVRGKKRQLVLDYITALTGGRGIVG